MNDPSDFGTRARECNEAAELCDDPWVAANVRELASSYRALAANNTGKRRLRAVER
jgi:hypothetical protein